jgi:two-component system sensor histidine kinase/response regulator
MNRAAVLAIRFSKKKSIMNFKNIKIGPRLGVSFGAVLVLVHIMAVLNIKQMGEIQRNLEKIVQVHNVKVEATNRMLDNARNMAVDARDLIFMTTEKDMDPVMAHYGEEKRQYQQHMGRLTALLAAQPGLDILTKIKAEQAIAEPMLDQAAALGRANRAEEGARLLLEHSRPAQLKWLDAMEEMLRYQKERAEEFARESRSTYEHVRRLSMWLMAYTVFSVIAIAWRVTRSITQPLHASISIAERVAAGDLSDHPEIVTYGETRQLLDALSRMKAALQQHIADNRLQLDRMVDMTERIPIAVFQLRVLEDGQVRFKFIGAPVRDLIGVEASEVMRDPTAVWRHMEPDQVAKWRTSVFEHFQEQKGEIDVVFPVQLGDQQRWVRWSARAHTAPDKRGVWSGFYEDVTATRETEHALRQAKEAAEAAAQAKSSFLANMSHEIRTPMNAILGMSHLALQTELSPRQRDYVHKIQTAGKYLLGIINDILDYSKVEAGKMAAEHIDFYLDSVLDNVIGLTAEQVKQHGLALHVDVAPDVPNELNGDPLRLGQILINFASNAVKFTPQGSITLIVRLLERAGDDALLHFAVRDTGIGLSDKQRTTLFQSFSQADASISRKYGGTGLGLAISNRLAALLGGEVGVDSVLGEGSTFWFTARVSTKRSYRRLSHAGLQGMRVLIVDDEEGSRRVIGEQVKAFGLVAGYANNGNEALRALATADAEQHPYHFVLLDWQMSGLDGVQTAKAIQALALATHPQLAIVTAHARHELRQQATLLGITHILSKPVSPSLLFEILLDLANLEPEDGPEEGTPVRARVNRSALSSIYGARVLLVEDNELNQQVASELLTGIGLHVDLAGDGQQGLDLLDSGRPYDLVLMDMQMPVLTGLQATEAIRADGRFPDLPIIAMTANVMSEDRQRCEQAGMNDFIGKPIEPDVLWSTLLRWIAPRQTDAKAANGYTLPPQSESAVEAPRIAGLDTAAGLRRVLGNLTTYYKMLQTFVRDQAALPLRLETALTTGDHTDAQALLHTLRGVAGNIGADTVQTLSHQLEQALGREVPAQLAQRQTALIASLEQVFAAIVAALPEQAPLATIAEVDEGQLASVCQHLLALLADNDSQAENLLQVHAALLCTAFGAHFDNIEMALDQFEFERAHKLLTAAWQARQTTTLENEA